MTTGMKLSKQLHNLGACDDAVEWVAARKERTALGIWRACDNPQWMLWLLGVLSGEKHSRARKRLLLCCLEIAETSYQYVKDKELLATLRDVSRMLREYAEGNGRDDSVIDAACSAAWSAAWSAWSAARSAARSACSAARSAESAAWSAESAACSAESAACSAARSAACSAARSAARSAESAACSAARSAARSAAVSIIRKHYPTPPRLPAKGKRR